MTSVAEEHVLYQVANAPIREYPYPHIYVEKVFPDDTYAQLRANWPGSSSLVQIAETGRVQKGKYLERSVMPLLPEEIDRLTPDRRAFWAEFAGWFNGTRFLTAMIDKFERYGRQELGDDLYRRDFAADALVVRDLTNFSIGPHTDAPHRFVTMLFYCPDDDSLKHLGTSIYVPRDPGFRCRGGPHYPHRLFQKVSTMEYRPNTLFAFFKNDRSFHGVEPIGDPDVIRDLMLYDVRVSEPHSETAQPDARTAGIGFNMLKRLFGSRAK